MTPTSTAHSVLADARKMIQDRDHIILEQQTRIRELEAAIINLRDKLYDEFMGFMADKMDTGPLERLRLFCSLSMNMNKNDWLDVEHFFNDVRAALELATLAERERCAEICDRFDRESSNPMNFAHNCAEAIRIGK